MEIKKQIDKFIKEFCIKHGVRYDEDITWVANRYAGILDIHGVYYLSLEDIILDMEKEQPKWNIFNWQNAVIDKRMRDDNFKNQSYTTWIMNGNKLLEV